MFLVAALTTSQSTATRTIVPIGLAAGLPAGVVTGMWAGALGGVYTLPANGTQIAAANFDLTGTTKLGTKLLDHSFFVPMLVLSVTTIVVGAVIGGGLLLTRSAPARRAGPSHRSTRPRRHAMETQEIADKAAALMPGLLEDLERAGRDPVDRVPRVPARAGGRDGASETLQMFQEVGFADARLMEVPTGYPPIYGEIAGPEGSPVVVLYAHYDVQPAPPEQGWTSDPWTATRKDDGRIYGRGAADDKGGLVDHLGTLRVFDGKPPCTVKLVLEGMEETESNLEAFVEAHPELFDCDLFVICDMGNLRVGEPALTTALRGDVACVVTVRTLEHPLHSGVFGGPAPDAMMALARLLADAARRRRATSPSTACHATPGTARTSAPRTSARAPTCSTGSSSPGRGPIGDRLWARPVDQRDRARHDVHRRLVERADPAGQRQDLDAHRAGFRPEAELDALVGHLETHAPWGAQVEVRAHQGGARLHAARPTGPPTPRGARSMAEAFGTPVGEAGCGGSIPLLRTLQPVAPRAEFILWGPEDVAGARIHASDESVDPAEIEKMVVAQALLLQKLADGASR